MRVLHPKTSWLLRFGAGVFLLAGFVQPARADCFHPGERWAGASARLAVQTAVRGPIKFEAIPSEPAAPLDSSVPPAPPPERKRCPAGFHCGPPTLPGAPAPAPSSLDRPDPFMLICQDVFCHSTSSLWPPTASLYAFDPIDCIEHPPRSS